MAEPTMIVNSSVTEALTVNAAISVGTTAVSALSSSSSGMSSSSPVSSLGSAGGGGGTGGVNSENNTQNVNVVGGGQQQMENSKRTGGSDSVDDSTPNANTVSSVTSSSTGTNNCNSSGEPNSSDGGGEHRGSTDDIISHLNMLSMHDGLGFNGFGLLGTGNGSMNVWAAANGMPNNISGIGNGMAKQGAAEFAPEPHHLGVANYIEALKLQQQFQFQQMKNGAEIMPNIFAPNPTADMNNAAAQNIFGAPIMQGQHYRRPIFGAGGENLFAAQYGNYFMNRPPPGVHYPPPMEFNNHGRGKASPNDSFAIINNENEMIKVPQAPRVLGNLNQSFSSTSTASSGLFNVRPQNDGCGGGLFAPTIPPPPMMANGTNGPMQYKPSMAHPPPFHHAGVPMRNGVPLVTTPLQQQNLRRGPPSTVYFNGNNRNNNSASSFSGSSDLFRSTASDISSVSSGGGSGVPPRYSRKVFVGGLPPDIDEGSLKRPSSVLKHSAKMGNKPHYKRPPTPNVINQMGNMPSIDSPPAITTSTPLHEEENDTVDLGHVNNERSRNESGQFFDDNDGELFSRKVFVGGLPMDIDEEEICMTFMRFGLVTVDWPHKVESKSYFPPKGYAFLIFQQESSVQALIDSCIPQDGRYYMCVSSPTMREKAVQIRPWRLTDADFVLNPNLPADPRKTVFVGGVPRPLKAADLAEILERHFGGVCYTGIDTDPELKYPKGAGRVTFSNQQSYITAISARFVQLQHGDIDKRVEIKPYVLDDQMCDECGGARCDGKYAPYFCSNVGCLQYYCEMCWHQVHSKDGREYHKPLVKEGTDRPRAVPFKWGM